MKKLELKRLTIAEMAEIMPIIEKSEQERMLGGGDGSSGNPYTWDEYEYLADNDNWSGGYVEGAGYTGAQANIYADSTHCVAYALANLGGVNLNYAISYLDSLYGSDGVPSSAIDTIITFFYPNATRVERSSLSTGPIANTFIWFTTSDSTGHAVNGLWNNYGEELIYSDPQNSNNINYISETDSCYIYRIQ
ncbi:MAG: hypothetical protein LBG80_00370 [Bacteroidales bacterium]|jgi:hypothetical protein|nr:hypothetical protein [Bacteroidales bacterium]